MVRAEATRSARSRDAARRPLDGGLPSEGGLRAGGSCPAMRQDFARIAVPGERAELLAGGIAGQALERQPGMSASCPIVKCPARRARLVTGPTPHIGPTGRSSRNAGSVSGSTTTGPSGLATCEAIFARCFVRATPTEWGARSTARNLDSADHAGVFGGGAEEIREPV